MALCCNRASAKALASIGPAAKAGRAIHHVVVGVVERYEYSGEEGGTHYLILIDG